MKNKIAIKILIAFLIMSLLVLVSCRAELHSPKEGEVLAYVNLDLDALRSLTSTCEPEEYGNLYWFYTAEKAKGDGYGTTGSTGTNEIGAVVAPTTSGDSTVTLNKGLGSSSSIGPFSYGSWVFTLKGYAKNESESKETENKTVIYRHLTEGGDISTIESEIDLSDYTLVYASDNIAVSLQSPEVKVSASVKPQGTTGRVKFKNAYLTASKDSPSLTLTIKKSVENEGGTSALVFTTGENAEENKKLRLEKQGQENSNKYKISFEVNPDLEEGTYNCMVKIDESEITNDPFSFAVCGNATTVISGDLAAPEVFSIQMDSEQSNDKN